MRKQIPLRVVENNQNEATMNSTNNLHVVTSPNKNDNSDLEVFITKDEDLLKQYYDLRHESYRGENGWSDFDGAEGYADRNGQIVVAKRDGKVVGGMRIMFSDECNYLSNEIPGTQYEYKKFIHKYDDREDLVVAEISALVVRQGYRDSNITLAMFDCLFSEAKRHKCHYVFAVAIALVCRSDRKTLRKLGYDVEIVMNFPWKEKRIYNFARMFLMYARLK